MNSADDYPAILRAANAANATDDAAYLRIVAKETDKMVDAQ